LSVSEDRTAQSTSVTLVSVPSIADPGPLGLAAFALTTFLLSAKNAGWMTHATGSAWLGFAFAYGGLAQLCAAMWEFRNRNVVGATGFGTFAAFWIGLGLWILLVVNPAVAGAEAHPATAPTVVATLNHDLGWILLGFAIFTLYATILILQTNTALFVTFLLLFITLVVLCIGNFNAGSNLAPTTTIKIGGYIGLATALAAWYTSAAGMSAGIGGKIKIPTGPRLI
jgi:succinate-acetate transporter protein